MTIEYIVFFSLLLISLFFFVLGMIFKPNHAPVMFDLELQKTESPIERKLYRALLLNGYHVRTQYIVPPRKFRIDLALPIEKIAIECDGKDYHSSPQQKARDKRKDNYLKQNGWIVLRFSGRQINGNLRQVLKRIEREAIK